MEIIPQYPRFGRWNFHVFLGQNLYQYFCKTIQLYNLGQATTHDLNLECKRNSSFINLLGYHPYCDSFFTINYDQILALMCKIFSIVPSRKLRQTKGLLFNFIILKLTKTPIFSNCKVPNCFFFCITVNFIIFF